MNHKYNVLWVEDGARFELAYLAAPVYMDGRYKLTVAQDVSEASHLVERIKFQALIVDIRLPPGEDNRWGELYGKVGGKKAAASLGIKLLRSMLHTEGAEVELDIPRSWVTPEKIGVLTVESYEDIQETLYELGIRIFHKKSPSLSNTVLLDLIEQICKTKIKRL